MKEGGRTEGRRERGREGEREDERGREDRGRRSSTMIERACLAFTKPTGPQVVVYLCPFLPRSLVIISTCPPLSASSNDLSWL